MRFSIKELSEKFQVPFTGNPSLEITGVNILKNASFSEVSFFGNEKYKEDFLRSHAGLICVKQTDMLVEGKNYLICKDPSFTFGQIASLFLQENSTLSFFTNIHPTAVIDPSAHLGKNVTIAPYVVIDKNVEIGNNTYIGPHVSISHNVKIGDGCIIHPHVTIRENCILKNRVILQPGCVIGSCGFGYAPDNSGNFQKLEQLGNVILEDDVEIGANTTVDRARIQSTTIGKNSKIDNLVQIAHNVEIGPNNAIASQTGIAGSAKTGTNVIMGGQVGVTGHIKIGDNCLLATRCGVSKSLASGGKYRGSPAIPIHECHRNEVQLRNIDKLYKKIDALEKKLEELQKSASSKCIDC